MPIKNADRYTSNQLKKTNYLLDQLHASHQEEKIDYSVYKGMPCEFARDILNTYWWEKQCYIAHLAETHKKILVRASHMVGKSYMLSGYCVYNWRTEDVLRGTILAPTLTHVKDVIFSNIRKFMGDDVDIIGSASPTLYNSANPEKILKGLSANEAVSIQGRHTAGVALIVIDEATGIPAEYWESIESISHGGGGSRWICAYNPIDTSSMVAQLEKNPDWKVVVISALEHPNVKFYDNDPHDPFIPIPGAITGVYFNELMRGWSTPINKNEAKLTDIRLPGTDQWVRPSAIGEARLLGRWPTIGYESIWTDAIFEVVETNIIPSGYQTEIPEFGVDVARYGNDHSAIAIRQGGKLTYLDEYYGLSIVELTNLVTKKVDEEAFKLNINPELIPIKIDANGVGAGVVDLIDDLSYNAVEVQVSEKAYEPEKYANKRSELWFKLRDKALNGYVSFTNIPTSIANKLRIELLSPIYMSNSKGQIVVESKMATRKRTKVTSPNLADAVNLAYYDEEPGISITVKEK